MVLFRERRKKDIPSRIRFINGKYQREAAGPWRPLWRIASRIGSDMNSRAIAIPKQSRAGKRAQRQTRRIPSLSSASIWNPIRFPIASNSAGFPSMRSVCRRQKAVCRKQRQPGFTAACLLRLGLRAFPGVIEIFKAIIFQTDEVPVRAEALLGIIHLIEEINRFFLTLKDLDFLIGGGALARNAPHFANHVAKLRRLHQLAVSGPGCSRDALVDQCPAEVIGPCHEADLGELGTLLDPGDL